MSKAVFSAGILFLVCCSLANAQEKATGKVEPLAPLGRFVGGEWVVHGKWNSGQELHARSVYTWGVGNKVLLGKTFVQDGKGGEYQRYEEIFYFHPKRQRLEHLSVAFNGELSETVADVVDANTLKFGYTPFQEGQTPKVRQVITFLDNDSFTWKVDLQVKDGWQPLIEATWKRQTAK
jgi:hypothetical protein